MTTILDQPAKVDREGERLYFYAPGEVCVDICSGRPEDRKRVMALLEHSQRAFRVLDALLGRHANLDDVRAVLGDVGVGQ